MKKFKLLTLLALCIARPAMAVPIELDYWKGDHLVAKIPYKELDETYMLITQSNKNLPTSIKLPEEVTVESYIVDDQNTLIPFSFEAEITGIGGLMIYIKQPDLNASNPRVLYGKDNVFIGSEIKKNGNPSIMISADGAAYEYVKDEVSYPIDDANKTYEFLQVNSGRLMLQLVSLPPVCGNGDVEGIEACDDGNQIDDDQCSNQCTANAAVGCGNGIVEPGEECDDGNQVNDDECSNACVKVKEQNPDEENPEQDQNQGQDNGGCSLGSGASSQAGILSLALSFLALGAVRLRKNS